MRRLRLIEKWKKRKDSICLDYRRLSKGVIMQVWIVFFVTEPDCTVVNMHVTAGLIHSTTVV